MAKLTIGNQTVTIDDAFLSMSPEQQQATVDEIASSLGGSQAAPSTAYTDALANASQASQRFAGAVPPRDAQAEPGRPNVMGSIATTLAGVNTVPVVGPALQMTSDAIMGAGSALTGGDYGETVRGLQDRREELARANPVANLAGSIGANLAAFGAAGAPRAITQGLSPAAMTLAGGQTVGSSALGLSGSTAAKVGNSIGSTLGLMTADGIMRGEAPTEALANAALPSGIAGAIPVAGAVARRGAEGVASAVTKRAQQSLTNGAIKGAPPAEELFGEGSKLFEASTGGTPLAISDNAFFRFMGGVRGQANKLRINEFNDPEGVGLLQYLMEIADDTSRGVAVDLKDLHLARQFARDVASSSKPRTASIGTTVVRELDDLIRTLKPDDILGGGDPTEASRQLLSGISTWSRAIKVGSIEKAIRRGQVAASGPEKGIRNELRRLVKGPDWNRYTKAEQQAILDVVDGTSQTNFLKLLGTFGFGGNTATNGVGGAVGLALGNMAGGPMGMIAAPIVASIAKNASEKATKGLANRAAQVAATANVPIARQRQVPQSLLNAIPIAELAGRGALLGNN